MEINLVDEIKCLNQTIIKSLFREKKNDCYCDRPRPLQMAILRYVLDNSEECICQKDLEEQFGISKSAISYTLNAMEKNNLIERISNESDTRKRYIIPTKNSIEMNKELTKGINKVNEGLLNSLSEEEIDEFLRIIKKLKEHMKEGI